MFPETKSRKTSGLEGEKSKQFSEGPYIECFVIYLDTFEFDQGYVTKNQPITVLVLLSENQGI